MSEVLTICEFCQRYRISRAKLYNCWSSPSCGPKRTRVGRRVYIRLQDAEEWLLGHRE